MPHDFTEPFRYAVDVVAADAAVEHVGHVAEHFLPFALLYLAVAEKNDGAEAVGHAFEKRFPVRIQTRFAETQPVQGVFPAAEAIDGE